MGVMAAIQNQYYLLDLPPTGRVLHDLARCLVDDGHEVRVVCSCRSYAGGGKRRQEIEEFCREHPDGNIKLLPDCGVAWWAQLSIVQC